VEKRRLSVYFEYLGFTWRLWKRVVSACGDGEYYFQSCFPALQGDGVSEASTAVDRKSIGHTVGEL
jgi:hypothetical protein